jgi:hypothetical protein
MKKRKATRTRATRPPKVASVLERLEAREARTVLQRLLAAHPDLRSEAEQLARSLLRDIKFESVADDVEHALRSLDLDDLGGCAGRHRGGYTSPTDAAWELLHEAVEPFLSDMKRQMELGLEVEAREVCMGVLLGLYRIRNSRGDEFLGWAEDFPAEAAADAVGVLVRGQEGAARIRRARPQFNEEFVEHHVPEWRDLITHALERR